MYRLFCSLLLIEVLAMGFAGCSGASEDVVVRRIAKNTSLSEAEREYAMRYYELFVIEGGRLGQVKRRMDKLGLGEPYTIQTSTYPRDMYEKWGLGNTSVSLKEKAYLESLHHMVSNWESYQSKLKMIDVNNLNEEQEKFISVLHQKCGPAPVNLRDCWGQEAGSLSEDHESYLRLYKALTGHEKLTDLEILALR